MGVLTVASLALQDNVSALANALDGNAVLSEFDMSDFSSRGAACPLPPPSPALPLRPHTQHCDSRPTPYASTRRGCATTVIDA